MATLSKIRFVWLATTASLMTLILWMVFLWVPTEVNQGNIQRALYFHVPVAWTAMVAIVLIAVASIAYLKTRNEKWDRLAVAGAETGVIFAALMLITGMVWAKPVWGVWWTGEAKLTTTLILFFIYVAYLMIRSYAPSRQKAQVYAAVVGIVGFVDVPIVYYSVIWWRSIHPSPVVGPLAGESALNSTMSGVLLFSLSAVLRG